MVLLLRRVVRSVPTLRKLRPPAPEQWPRVSLIMQARDEERVLEGALRSKLRDVYPAIELILVNDRSMDGPGGRGLRPHRAAPLGRPCGHAPGGVAREGARHAAGLGAGHGEWVLFSDANIHLESRMLERVIAYAEHEGFDHVCVLQTLTCSGMVHQATLTTFYRLLCAGGQLWAVPDPHSSAAIGVGAFNLVRRSTLLRSPGLEWLKMEIGDDAALGVMLKLSGARQAVLNGCAAVSLEFYPSYQSSRGRWRRTGRPFRIRRPCLATSSSARWSDLSSRAWPRARRRWCSCRWGRGL